MPLSQLCRIIFELIIIYLIIFLTTVIDITIGILKPVITFIIYTIYCFYQITKNTYNDIFFIIY